MYSSDNLNESSEKKPEKRRSFLQQPKSYTSHLPTAEDSLSKSYTSKLPTYDDTSTKSYSSKLQSYDDSSTKAYSSRRSSYGDAPPRPYSPKQPTYGDSLSRSYHVDKQQTYGDSLSRSCHSDISSYEDRTPKTQPIAIPKPETSQADTYEFFIGDRVRIGGLKTGTLLYFGAIHLAPGLWCGIALDEAEGTHDGFVSDVRYFTCRKKHGIFAPVDKVTHVDVTKVQVAEPPPKVSDFRSKPKVCSTDSLREYTYPDRSREYIDEQEEEEPIPGLDELGIIRDDDDEPEFVERSRRRRKLPKLPKTSHGVSRLHYLKRETVESERSDENLVDEAAEKLKMIAEDVFNENDIDEVIKTLQMQEEKFDNIEPQHSAGGSSSAGSESWSLEQSSKDVLEMCNGSGKEYFNITFDGDHESDSKTSTKEPSVASEESPSPEFIFDQEMIEDGEFSSQPINISRDSSLGLLTSITLEKGEALFDIMAGDSEDSDKRSSQETLEAMTSSGETMHTPEKPEKMDQSIDFGEVSASTPFSVPENRSVQKKNLNSTFTKDGQSSHIEEKPLNSTFTKDEKSSRKDSATKGLNDTFTVSEIGDNLHNRTHDVSQIKAEVHGKGAMLDSGISMKASMSDSAMTMKGAFVDSSTTVKGSLMDSSIPPMKHSMADSGIASCRNSMIDSGFSGRPINVYNVQGVENEYKDEMMGKQSGDILDSKGLDDQKLMSDLRRGHEKRERPISFMSTTSADTGYVPDTDSELGTLTLNSPQEWMEKGYHGNLEQLPEMTSIQKNLIEDFQDSKKPVPVSIESDSDIGLLTGDTDNEGPEIVMPVQPDEAVLSGVDMETAESEDEITQVEDLKNQNVTVTLEDKMDGTFTKEPDSTKLDGTFTLPDSEEKSDGSQDSGVPMVTVVIEDGESEGKDKDESLECKNENEKNNEKPGKVKTPKKKKFNVVKDFKKPNTTNVVSKLSEYLKAPVPVKPKDDKDNTVEAKNKRNSLKGKVDLNGSKLESKVNDEKKIEEKKEKEVIEKEPVKKVKRTPPKSKWGAIMSQIDNHKDDVKPKTEVKSKLAELLKAPPPPVVKKEVEKPKNKWDAIMSQIDSKKGEEKTKPKTEVKSKLAEMLKAPPPAPKKEAEPKPKRRLSRAIPDYSKVQSKFATAGLPPAKPKDESPNRSKTESPNRSKTESPSRKSSQKTESPSRKSDSPSRSRTRSTSDQKETTSNKEKNDLAQEESKETDKSRNSSGDSVKRPEIKDGALHIDLAEVLERRSSAVGTGSGISSRQSSKTDLSTTEPDDVDSGTFKVPTKKAPMSRASSQPVERRDSVRSVSELSDNGSQVTGKENEEKKTRRKSSLIPPTNSPGGGARIVKPVIRRQVSVPSSDADHMTKPSVFTNQAATHSPSPTRRARERNQNRNKTNKSKSTTVKAVKPPEPIPADVHTREVQRLEALCEDRTKQVKMLQLHIQNTNTAFDGMSTIVNYLANDLDGFSCPRLVEEKNLLNEQLNQEKKQTASLEKKRSNLEELIKQLKEQHKDYIHNLETEQEQSLNEQKTTLTNEKLQAVQQVEEKHAADMVNLKKTHEAQLYHIQHELTMTVDKLNTRHTEEIKNLQKKQEHQMEELHKQHQDKLEDITQRFDGIKLTLSEKVESLKSECDRLRDRARLCEDALQRDSDYKVQLAIAPYKNLPQEIESLKTVLEMRNDEIQKLRSHNTELAKKLEELPVAQEKIIALQQKKENLEAIISMKTDHEKTLHEKCQNLMKKYDKESRANKRLSMEYEELMWKLSESFSEVADMDSQEAQFYRRLGMSPTDTEPPEFGRKLKTPEGNRSSWSPSYRRSTSSSTSGDDEKRFKRRSGTHLMNNGKGENSLARSWSPAALSSSSPSRARSVGHDRMTQSWNEADVFESPESETDQVIMRHKSGRRKRTVSEQDRERNGGDQDFTIEISVSPRISKESLNRSEDSICSNSVINLNGITAENPNSSLPECDTSVPARSGRETVTLTESSKVFKEQTSPRVTQQNGDDEASENQSEDHHIENQSTDSAKLPTQTVTCPPSLIPTRQTASGSRSQEDTSRPHEGQETQNKPRKIPTRSSKESVV